MPVSLQCVSFFISEHLVKTNSSEWILGLLHHYQFMGAVVQSEKKSEVLCCDGALPVHKVLADGLVLAGVGCTFIDVFLTVQA